MISFVTEITEGSGICVSSYVFKLRNNLHCPDFWGAAYSAGRKSGSYKVKGIAIRSQFPDYLRNNMHGRGNTFPHSCIRLLERSRFHIPAQCRFGQDQQASNARPFPFHQPVNLFPTIRLLPPIFLAVGFPQLV